MCAYLCLSYIITSIFFFYFQFGSIFFGLILLLFGCEKALQVFDKRRVELFNLKVEVKDGKWRKRLL